MASNSDKSYVEISVEDTPDKNQNKKILEFVCSPNLKHVAALHENNDISFWSIIDQGKLSTDGKPIHIGNIRTNEKIDAISDDEYVSIRKIFAISDNKQVSISLDRTDPYNFKIFDLETKEEIKLTFSDWQKEIDFLSFIENGNIIMVNAKYCRAYVFFIKIFITPKGKLIIFNDTIYEIIMWDIEDLSIKTRILMDWNYIPESIKISDDEELLLVYARNYEAKETYFYVFSTETGINLSYFKTPLVIDKFKLIASQKGERLLYIAGEQYYLMDPYIPINPIDASDLFEKIEENFNQIQEPYLILSDKIIYFINGKLSIKELVPDNSDDWIKYLRKELRDDYSITAPSKKTIDIITELITNKNYNPDKKNFDGKILKWELESDDKSVKLTVVDYNFSKKKRNNNKKQLDILPSLKNVNSKNYIVHCEILENDDLITITRIGRILPVSSYETICKNLDIKFGDKELFNMFLRINIRDEFYLTCYGRDLMKTLIEQKDDKWIRYLGQYCINKCLQRDTRNYMISKISLLSIIFESFNGLSENHPAFMTSVLSLIEFVIPSTIVNPKSTSSHLSKYGRYYHLYNTSFIDILTSIFWDRWISSWNFLDLAAILSTTATSIDWLKNGSAPTWAITFTTLFTEIKFILFFRSWKFFGIYLAMIMNTVDKVISFVLIFGLFTLAFAHSLHLLLRSESEIFQEVLQLPEEKNEEKFKELHIFKETENEKLKELHILKEIEKTIKDLPVLKQDIKELKESIEVMKTNK
ncbi:transient receptor potential cation channel subfamily V member 4-like [Gigaspora margarita]|uniref:Transient receptor potential cation channel subfamily V member 4-like n=1 Tax=Gigaspora margarita TaxID=4874 RepID=A0A8H4EMI4_GIGMA|nr:transient receptor potential cation channel subfamily V member 4-like [Gigaspora margarita]